MNSSETVKQDSRILSFLQSIAEGLLYRNNENNSPKNGCISKMLRSFGSNINIIMIKAFVLITFIFYDNLENTYISSIFKKDKYGIVIIYAILSALRYYEFFKNCSLEFENTKEKSQKVTYRDVYFIITCFRVIIFNCIFSFHISDDNMVQTFVHYLFFLLMIIISYMGHVVFFTGCRQKKQNYLLKKIIIFIIFFVIMMLCGNYAAKLKDSANYNISDSGLNSRKFFNLLTNASESVLIIYSL